MYNNINILNRASRLTLSYGLVFVLLSISAPLGSAAYAVFVSLYAGITGTIGWDPVIALMGRMFKGSEPASGVARHGGLAAR